MTTISPAQIFRDNQDFQVNISFVRRSLVASTPVYRLPRAPALALVLSVSLLLWWVMFGLVAWTLG